MAEDPAASSQRYRLPSLSDRGALVRLAAIGASVLAIALCFAYVGGWLSPGRLGEARFVDRFEEVNGVHPGFRRNHAKGVCIAGNFDSNGQGVRLSKAVVFTPGRVPVTGRFSLAGGHPHVADGPTAVLAMALRLQPPAGQEWRMAMIDIPVFLVKDGEGLYEQLLASQPDPKTGQPDPAKMAAFTAAHPEFLPAMQIVKSTPLPSGFSNATFNGLNAFRFVNASGAATAVRWSMVASEPFTPETPEQAKSPDKNYLFDDLIARVRRGPLQWHLLVTIGAAGRSDQRPDATVAARSRARRCRHAHDRPSGNRSARQLPRHQFRSAGAARGHRAVRRSHPQRQIGDLFAIVHPARGRDQDAERGSGPRRQGLMIMTPHRPFPLFSRILHWTMAVLVLAMLFIGIGMVSSVSAYHQLVVIHKPLGILVLVLVAIRLVNRLINPPPPLPDAMPPWQRFAALGSHVLLYVLMFAVPIVGWAMLSAARYPVVLYGPLQLPPIMPQNPELFAVLRETHTVLALLLFVTFLAHFGAALMHALIFRDEVFPSMTFWRWRERAGMTSSGLGGRSDGAAAPALAKSE